MKVVKSSWYIYFVLILMTITSMCFISGKNTDIETKLD